MDISKTTLFTVNKNSPNEHKTLNNQRAWQLHKKKPPCIQLARPCCDTSIGFYGDKTNIAN